MTEKKQALLLFSKPPVPGMVKTRLTTKHGGFLSDGQAAEFFKRSLYDVSELAMHALLALQAENDALVAADPDADEDHLRLLRVHHAGRQRGADAPDLRRHWPVAHGDTLPHRQGRHVRRPLRRRVPADLRAGLREHRVGGRRHSHHAEVAHPAGVRVAGLLPEPGHAGLRAGALPGVRHVAGGLQPQHAHRPPGRVLQLGRPWRRSTPTWRSCRRRTSRRRTSRRWPTSTSSTDLAHAISCMRAIEAAAQHQTDLFVPRRVLDWVDYMGIQVSTPPNDEHDPRQYIDE